MNTTRLQPITAGGKTLQVIEVLAKLARQMGQDAKLPTTRDLCKKMGISQSTLDAALDRLEFQGLLYRRQGSGIYVASMAHIRRIGLIVQQDSLEPGRGGMGNFDQLLLSFLRSECGRRDEMLTVYGFSPQHDVARFGPQQMELDAQSGRMDALIALGLDYPWPIKVPCVYLTPTDIPLYEPWVSLDYREMVAQGVRALVRAGCERIGLAYPSDPHNVNSIYCDAFQQALRAEGVVEDPLWLMPFEFDKVGLRMLEASRRFVWLWEESDVRPDGLLSMDDHYTAGLLHGAEVLGVRIPQDLMVASHANKGLDLFNGADVIRLEYDPAEVARVLLDTVDELLAGNEVKPALSILPQVFGA